MIGAVIAGQPPAFIACGVLAALGTSLSLAMSAAGGWHRGDSQLNSVLWSSLGVLATLAAHLLPATSRLASGPIRGFAWILWAACFAFAAFSHASYFLLSQDTKGAQRAEAVLSPVIEYGRTLSKVLTELGELDHRIATISGLHCQLECPHLRRQLARLQGQRRALAQEVLELRQNEAKAQAREVASERARTDAAAYALGSALSLRPQLVQDALGAVVGLLVDGIACVAWTLMLASRGIAKPVVARLHATEEQPPILKTAATAAITNRGPSKDPTPAAMPQEEALAALVAQAREAVAAGQVRATVEELRKHLRCSQRSAVMVRRAVVECD